MERRTILTILLLAVLALASQILVWIFRPRETDNDFVGPPSGDAKRRMTCCGRIRLHLPDGGASDPEQVSG